ncbi:hypothetical protein RchiOBHm_Chr1g0375191 [Rosa chinensis]|uniref:Uncharacterized protein n=1 Tax=Rosa chinensis TaxID=74649 RepID=A0A2P6SMJ1_ROSCH|nr:hypothetical protein RchiOBHm_Chr1g0375191 [Rosa chinensis]
MRGHGVSLAPHPCAILTLLSLYLCSIIQFLYSFSKCTMASLWILAFGGGLINFQKGMH